jgi:drug/metabolite transporter (DMT)-like permease
VSGGAAASSPGATGTSPGASASAPDASPPAPPRARPRGLPPRLAALLAIIFWGISFVATKAALRELPPISLITTRFVMGSVLLHAMLAARREPLLPPRAHWGALALMGFIGVFVHMLLQSYALTRTTAVRTGWLIGLIPIWSALLAVVFLRERMGPMKLAGLALGFLGAAVVVTRGRFDASFFALPSTPGDLLILVSTLNWAIYTVLGHGTIRALGSARATAAVMAAGTLMLLPLFVVTAGWRPLTHLSPVGIGAVLFLGLGCSGLAYLWWYAALERIETSKVATFLYLEPLVTLAAAVVLLHEEVGLATVLGGLIVLAGVALVQRAPAGKRA